MKILKESRSFDETDLYGMMEDAIQNCDHYPYYQIVRVDENNEYIEVELMNYRPEMAEELADTLKNYYDAKYVKLKSEGTDTIILKVWF